MARFRPRVLAILCFVALLLLIKLEREKTLGLLGGRLVRKYTQAILESALPNLIIIIIILAEIGLYLILKQVVKLKNLYPWYHYR